MFYDGDLQSGIALALKDSKLVACFIKGNDEQTSLWESDYLQDHQVRRALDSRAVTLCIDAGSPEAGYLEAYYPIPVVPAFIVINNGQLVLDLRSGEAKDSFKAAVLKTLVSRPPNTVQSSSSPPIPTPATEPTMLETSSREGRLQNTETPAHDADASATSDQTPRSSRTTNTPTNTASASVSNTSNSTALGSDFRNSQTSQTVQNLLADRRRRLELDKKEKEAVEKAERKAKVEARKASTTTDPNSAKAKQATYAQQQRQRQQDARLERERILRHIEHDKAERKEKEEARKAVARAQTNANDGAGGLVDEQLSGEMSRLQPRNARECAIQVRLFDGGTIRSRFRSDNTLRKEVREWVDKVRPDGDFPYTFKHILAPLPNRTLSISDEEDSLQHLGLVPSATLVMVPIQGYTAAYDGNQSLLSKGAAVGYNVVSAGTGLVTGALSTFLGLGQATAQDQRSSEQDTKPPVPESSSRGSTSGINIRTLRDQQENRDDHQFYNGNQLNFEPRSEPEDREID